MTNIYASCVDIEGKGVLILGDSGSGKSDLVLRLIKEFGATLVADDRTEINIINEQILASAPSILQGMLEVRGIGIINLPFCKQTQVVLAIKLVDDAKQVSRMPQDCYFEISEHKVRCFYLFGKEASVPAKIIAALTLV